VHVDLKRDTRGRAQVVGGEVQASAVRRGGGLVHEAGFDNEHKDLA
jgi:hypothetical protein